MQKVLYLVFDLFCIFFCADEPQEPIVCVSDILESFVVWVVQVD